VHHPPAARADVIHALTQAIQVGRAGADVGAGAAGAAEHIGIDEIGGHLGKPQGELLGAYALAQEGRLHHAAIAVLIELAHPRAGVNGNLVGRDGLAERFPAEARAAQGIRGRKDRHGEAPGMAPGGIELLRIEPRGELASDLDSRLASFGDEGRKSPAALDFDRIVVYGADGPSGR